jgi:hypothetical protein
MHSLMTLPQTLIHVTMEQRGQQVQKDVGHCHSVV